MPSNFIRVANGAGENIAGKHRRNLYDLVGPASYVNGTGIPIYPQNVGMKEIFGCDQVGGNATSLGFITQFVSPTPSTGVGFLRVYVRTTGVEVANLTNLSTSTFRMEAIGH